MPGRMKTLSNEMIVVNAARDETETELDQRQSLLRMKQNLGRE